MIGVQNDKIQEEISAPLNSFNSNLRKKLVMALVVVLILVAAWFFVGPSEFPSVGGSVWQAVFLDNNQVYFGHLRSYSESYAVLTNIFYLRAAEPLQQNSPPQGPNLNLVKLGDELHGPQDTMYIPKGKITFWENLKSDSQVSQAINAFLAQQKQK